MGLQSAHLGDSAGKKESAGPAGGMPAVDDPIIELDGVHKSFGALRVLAGIDLAIEPRKTTVIIGASGVGKSVVLKHIVGLLLPDRGDVRFHGQSLVSLGRRELSKIRARFGFLFQMSALFDSLTVAENIAFPIVEHGVEHGRTNKKDVEERVAEKLRMVGLDGTQTKRPAELSGGQRKRVALARAIALDPEVILYDEPTTGLDPIRADVINELILKMKSATGATGVVVTHDMVSVRKVADRIVMLHEGRVIFDGTIDEIDASSDGQVRRFVEGRASDEDMRRLKSGTSNHHETTGKRPDESRTQGEHAK